MDPTVDKNPSTFRQVLSLVLVVISGMGALLVLVDPVITFETAAGTIIKVGGNGFADQMKGAVVTMILIGGFTGVVGYWLGQSASGDKSSETIGKIAQDSPTVAAAVAMTGTGSGGVRKVETMNVQSDETNVTTGDAK